MTYLIPNQKGGKNRPNDTKLISTCFHTHIHTYIPVHTYTVYLKEVTKNRQDKSSDVCRPALTELMDRT